MIKIKHGDVAKMIRRSPLYTRQLLVKDGVSMKDPEGVMEFIMKYRVRERVARYLKNCDEKVNPKNEGLGKNNARKIVDEYFGFDLIHEKYKKKIGACEECGGKEKICVHHKDGNHWNNDEKNFQVLCIRHHVRSHKVAK